MERIYVLENHLRGYDFISTETPDLISTKHGETRTKPPLPTAARCFPNQLLGASLLRCNTTVLLCSRLVMSYHAVVISLFSRRRFSTSCWSSTCDLLENMRANINSRTQELKV